MKRLFEKEKDLYVTNLANRRDLVLFHTYFSLQHPLKPCWCGLLQCLAEKRTPLETFRFSPGQVNFHSVFPLMYSSLINILILLLRRLKYNGQHLTNLGLRLERRAASDLGLHCLLRQYCPKTKGK